MIDQDLHHRTYSIRQIAGSYQDTHVTVWNMPNDDELLHALKLNGHGADKLDELKSEYRRLSEKIAPYSNKQSR